MSPNTKGLVSHSAMQSAGKPRWNSAAAFPEWDRVADEHAATLPAAALADELSITVGAEFSRRFANAAVLPSGAGAQKWKHPMLGDLHLAYESLAVSGAEDLRLVVYVQGMSSTRPS
ncbi:MmyB family transcriptional regulator [Allokutzneria oryzae]|uniref:MmyB-like transcription regulator ligand binding domain-containing protein n=1 Tax=Allokutzneria oryzae TaxID=1378989 RepID=A0ABV6ABE2_9PSEU